MMATDEAKRYNGWANYETWNVRLWLDNEEPLYRDVMAEVREQIARINDEDEDDYERDDAEIQLAEWLESYVEEMHPEVSGMFSDLLQHAIGKVDWMEIAKAYIGDELD